MKYTVKVKFDDIMERTVEEARLHGVIIDENACNDIRNTIKNKPIIDKHNNAIGHMISDNEGILYLDCTTQLSNIISTPSDIGTTTINGCNFNALCIKGFEK